MQTVFFSDEKFLFACHALIVTRKIERVLLSYFLLFLCLFQNRFKTVIVRGLGIILFKIGNKRDTLPIQNCEYLFNEYSIFFL
jgi:hypothetical protein